MTLLVEDGSLVDGSNTYATVVELDAYLADRGYAEITNKEPMLVRAYSFMQGLPWCADHTEVYTVEPAMKDAQCEIAYRISLGFDPSETIENTGVKREKVDVLEVEYFSAGRRTSALAKINQMPQARALLDGLLCGGGSYIDRA